MRTPGSAPHGAGGARGTAEHHLSTHGELEQAETITGFARQPAYTAVGICRQRVAAGRRVNHCLVGRNNASGAHIPEVSPASHPPESRGQPAVSSAAPTLTAPPVRRMLFGGYVRCKDTSIHQHQLILLNVYMTHIYMPVPKHCCHQQQHRTA